MSLNDLNNDGIAMDGMDPVSYRAGEPLRGRAEYSSELRGITYRFANQENLEAFQEDPAKFIPDYAGNYLHHPQHMNQADPNQPNSTKATDPATLRNQGMNEDVIQPAPGPIDPELKVNPGYETDDEVEMSNLHDSNS